MESASGGIRGPTVLARTLINREYALLSLGQFASTLGDRVFDTTLILWIAVRLVPGASWAPLAVSGTLAAASLPSLVSPVVGVFVDRWDRRITMLWSDILRALLVALLILTTGTVTPDLHLPVAWHLAAIYAAVLAMSTCTLFFQPARLAIIQDVVQPDQRAKATSIALTLRSIASLSGPPLAAPILFGFGLQWALAVNSLSFLVSFLAISLVRASPPEARSSAAGRSIRGEMIEGVRFYRQNRVLRVVTVAAILALLGAGATSALSVFFLVENLHAPAKYLGFMGTANAAGILTGALMGSWVVARLGLQRTFSLTLAAIGIIILAYSRITNLPAALAVDLLIGITAGLLNVPMIPIIMAVTPRRVIGRVFAVFSPCLDITSLVSVVLAGYLVSLVAPGSHAHIGFLVFGRVDTVFAVSGVLSLVAGFYAYRRLVGTVLAGAEDAPEAASS
jgi:MFS family permease